MMTAPARPRSKRSRQLLDLAVEARMQYADYLLAVANGERPADPLEKESLKARCEEALEAWRRAHIAWSASAVIPEAQP